MRRDRKDLGGRRCEVIIAGFGPVDSDREAASSARSTRAEEGGRMRRGMHRGGRTGWNMGGGESEAFSIASRIGHPDHPERTTGARLE